MDFATKLKQARESAGLTQFDLAVKTGISLSAIQKWEGRRNDPRLRDFLKLCEFFEWSDPLREDDATRVFANGGELAFAS